MRHIHILTDRENREIALLIYFRTILVYSMNFPEDDFLRMYLERKISEELITDDVRGRFDRILQEKITECLQ